MGVNIDESLYDLDKRISNIWFINQPITNDVCNSKASYFSLDLANCPKGLKHEDKAGRNTSYSWNGSY